jgi:hypothetical protein
LPIGFVIATPAVAHQRTSKLKGFLLFFRIFSVQQATCEPAVKNEMRQPFRIACGVGDRLSGALRKPKQDESVEFSAVDNSFEIRHPLGK